MATETKELQAGAELDAMVLRDVMNGQRPEEFAFICPRCTGSYFSSGPDDKEVWCGDEFGRACKWRGKWSDVPPPPFSENIAAAAQVKAALWATGKFAFIQTRIYTPWDKSAPLIECIMERIGRTGTDAYVGELVPLGDDPVKAEALVICLAALAAVRDDAVSGR